MGPRPHLSFCACKTPWLAAEILVSMSPSHHLWFCAFKTATLWSELQVCRDTRPHLWTCACKTSWLALVSMGPSPHLWICALQNRDIKTTIKSLYVSQTSPVDLCKQNSFLSTKITSLYGSVLIELNKVWVRALLALPSLIRLLPRLYLAQ